MIGNLCCFCDDEADNPKKYLAWDEIYRESSKNNYVIYLSTFSKTISLGLRVGWITVADDLLQNIQFNIIF